MVVEKTRGIEGVEDLVGKFSIKINSDWEKKKTKGKSNMPFSFGG